MKYNLTTGQIKEQKRSLIVAIAVSFGVAAVMGMASLVSAHGGGNNADTVYPTEKKLYG